MPKAKSTTPGAIAARNRRSLDWEAKRFNNTLKEFLELKYTTIFNEYCSFYKILTEKHPDKRNLLTTSTFKEWKKATIEQTFEEDGLIAKVTFLSDREGSSSEAHASTHIDNEDLDDSTVAVNDDQSDSYVSDNEVNEDSTAADILTSVIDETLSDHINQIDVVNINEVQQANNIIDEIIADLEQDAEMRELLNNDDDNIVHDDDEGIALDYQTELDAIVESFDYELEVDL